MQRTIYIPDVELNSLEKLLNTPITDSSKVSNFEPYTYYFVEFSNGYTMYLDIWVSTLNMEGDTDYPYSKATLYNEDVNVLAETECLSFIRCDWKLQDPYTKEDYHMIVKAESER
jgi:hypothetical protein